MAATRYELSDDFTRAVAYAADAHAGQVRKTSSPDNRGGIPYVAHLLAVAALVIEDGGNETEAVAALLHDVIEDQGPHDGHPDREKDVREKFGDGVADIVCGCTGLTKEDEPDYFTRKSRYVKHLAETRNMSVVRVSLADKLHNARSTVADLEAEGSSVWDRFNAPAPAQLWWYASMCDAFAAHRPCDRRVDELRRLTRRMADFLPGS